MEFSGSHQLHGLGSRSSWSNFGATGVLSSSQAGFTLDVEAQPNPNPSLTLALLGRFTLDVEAQSNPNPSLTLA